MKKQIQKMIVIMMIPNSWNSTSDHNHIHRENIQEKEKEKKNHKIIQIQFKINSKSIQS